MGFELENAEKLPSVTTFAPKHPVTDVHEPGTTQEGKGVYGLEVHPLLVIVIEGVNPVEIELLVKLLPIHVPLIPLTVYVPLPPVAVKLKV